MSKNKKGLLARALENKALRDEYVKKDPKVSRWQLFWNIFKDNFKQISRTNLWMFLFFLPMVAVIFINVIFAQTNASLFPFGSNLGIGYPAEPELQGVAEWLTVQSGFYICVGILITSPIAAIGVAGGAHVVRNLLRGDEVNKVTKDFFKGVRLNYKNVVVSALLFCIVLLVGKLMIDLVDFNVASGMVLGAEVAWLRVAQVISYILIAFVAMIFLWTVSLNVYYEQTFFKGLKNAFFLTVGTLPQSVFFGVLAVAPFALFLLGNVSIMISIALVCLILFSFACALLAWLDFSQWVFDRYITPKQQRKNDKKAETKENRGKKDSYLAPGKVKPLDDGKSVEELPKDYTRKDLKKARENKRELLTETDAENKTE